MRAQRTRMQRQANYMFARRGARPKACARRTQRSIARTASAGRTIESSLLEPRLSQWAHATALRHADANSGRVRRCKASRRNHSGGAGIIRNKFLAISNIRFERNLDESNSLADVTIQIALIGLMPRWWRCERMKHKKCSHDRRSKDCATERRR